MRAVQSVEVEIVLDEVSRTASVPEKTANKEPLFARVMMIVTTHQPIFLPWPGFFYKAVKADCMVLLDDVQYPLGRGWANRNRLKNEGGRLKLE